MIESEYKRGRLTPESTRWNRRRTQSRSLRFNSSIPGDRADQRTNKREVPPLLKASGLLTWVEGIEHTLSVTPRLSRVFRRLVHRRQDRSWRVCCACRACRARRGNDDILEADISLCEQALVAADAGVTSRVTSVGESRIFPRGTIRSTLIGEAMRRSNVSARCRGAAIILSGLQMPANLRPAKDRRCPPRPGGQRLLAQ